MFARDGFIPEHAPEDRAFTKILCNGGKILNVIVLDHIIISGDKYYSFGEKLEIQ